MSFIIIRNDITKVSADAIVCTASPVPAFASGTEKAIYKAAGAKKLMAERKKIGKIMPGEVADTPAFDLDARYIFHTVGPAWKGGDQGEKEILKSCYESCLRLAKEKSCESIAFPLLATGNYKFPRAEALQIAFSVFSEFLSAEEMEIILVVFDNKSFELSGKIFSGVKAYIDKNYVEERFHEEYDAGRTIILSSADMSLCETVCCSLPDEEADDNNLSEIREKTVLAADEPKSALRSLKDVIANVGESWQESLFRLIDEKGYSDTEVYKRANMDRKLFSKIRSNKDYQPRKATAVSLALALKLNPDETRDFLKKAGLALSPGSIFDLIVEYFIDEGVYDIYTINLALFEHKQPLLGE